MPRTNVVGTTAPPGSGAQRCAQAGEREHGIESTAGTAAPAARSSPFHPLADRFPPIEGVEFDELVADIKANGLIEPIVMLDGMILDGRNRYRACVAADVEPTFRPFTGDDPAAYVISASIHRRHLTTEQKRDLIAKLIKTEPEKSNNAIAKQAKVDDKTVAKVRHGMEARSEIPNVSTRTDTKGRKQPARKGWSRERYSRHRAGKRVDDPEACAEAMKAKFAEAVASGKDTGRRYTPPGDTSWRVQVIDDSGKVWSCGVGFAGKAEAVAGMADALNTFRGRRPPIVEMRTVASA